MSDRHRAILLLIKVNKKRDLLGADIPEPSENQLIEMVHGPPRTM